MSSHTSGRLRVERANARLVAVARRTLDPQRFAAWVAAGRAGALEAARLLEASGESRLAALTRALDRGGVELALAPEFVLAAERDVLVTATTDALAMAGFALDGVDAREDEFSVVARRGEQMLTVRLGTDDALLVDVGIPGFLTTDECETARDSVVRALDEVGLTVYRPRDPAAMTEAVAAALPGFEIRSLIADDELQIIALPEEHA